MVREKKKPVEWSTARYMVAAASLFIVIGGLKLAAGLIVPVLLAAFLAIILFPVLAWLRRQGFSSAVSLLIIITGVILCGAGVTAIVVSSVNNFSENIDQYKDRLGQYMEEFDTWAAETFTFEGEKEPAEEAAPQTPAEPSSPVEAPDVVENVGEADAELGDAAPGMISEPSPEPIMHWPGEPVKHGPPSLFVFESDQAMAMLREVFDYVGRLTSQGVIILILVIFMLLEAAAFPAKLGVALGKSDPWNERVLRIADDVRHYMVIKTWTSLLTGTLVTVLLLVLGIDYAPMWGLIAFLFNYVPNIGSIIAAIPAIFLALLQKDVSAAAMVGIGYLVVNCAISYFIEPRFMGRGLGLSTLVVLLSLLFWGWVLGPVGMFLSAPLTMIVKICLEANPRTRWVAVLLGSKLPRNAPR